MELHTHRQRERKQMWYASLYMLRRQPDIREHKGKEQRKEKQNKEERKHRK